MAPHIVLLAFPSSPHRFPTPCLQTSHSSNCRLTGRSLSLSTARWAKCAGGARAHRVPDILTFCFRLAPHAPHHAQLQPALCAQPSPLSILPTNSADLSGAHFLRRRRKRACSFRCDRHRPDSFADFFFFNGPLRARRWIATISSSIARPESCRHYCPRCLHVFRLRRRTSVPRRCPHLAPHFNANCTDSLLFCSAARDDSAWSLYCVKLRHGGRRPTAAAGRSLNAGRGRENVLRKKTFSLHRSYVSVRALLFSIHFHARERGAGTTAALCCIVL